MICVDDLIASRLGEVYDVLVYFAFLCRAILIDVIIL